MKMGIFLSLPLIGVALSAAAPRAANSRWVVNFADAQCLAERDYGPASEPVRVVLKQPAIGDVIQVSVSPGRAGGTAAKQAGNVRFDGDPPLTLPATMFDTPAGSTRTYLFNVPVKDFARASTAKVMAVSAPGLREEFALSNVAPVMKLLDECVADLRSLYNIEPSGRGSRAAVKPPQGSLSGMIAPADMPEERGGSPRDGTAELLLLVDESGSVADCAIVGSSEFASLDGQTCAIMRARAKFSPAKGSDGTAVKGAFHQKVSWRME